MADEIAVKTEFTDCFKIKIIAKGFNGAGGLWVTKQYIHRNTNNEICREITSSLNYQESKKLFPELYS